MDIANEKKLETEEHKDSAVIAFCEDMWVKAKRPFYNVWPIAMDLARSVKLDLPFSAIEVPFNTMMLRFARGHEPIDATVAMLVWHQGPPLHVKVSCYFGTGPHRLTVGYTYEPEQQVQDWLSKYSDIAREFDDCAWIDGDEAAELISLLIRLCVFIGLLSHDRDMITPVVLSKDRRKYEATDDLDEKKWLEERAVRRAGHGFDVGKGLQLEKEKSPHWRNPHLCLFRIGPGRKKAILQMRSGSIVHRVSMAEVPTGYLGPETDEDDKIPDEKTPRESISKSRRFAVFKRDGNKCQLCGRSQDDGVKLHVDHRVPLAKGGSNEDENLWTLCEDCNLGKSDRSL